MNGRDAAPAVAATLGLTAFVFAAAAPALGTPAGDRAVAKYAAAWEKVNGYTCTIVAREVSGSHVQDRTYAMKFRKPHDTRMDITGGDGRGSAVVWDGSDRVYGHKGGLAALFKMHLGLHDRLATSLRGATVADANFGALLDHLKGLKGATIDASADGALTKINITVADATADQNVTREMFVLGADDLPVEYDQWEGETQVKRITYSDVVLNPSLPDSTFTL